MKRLLLLFAVGAALLAASTVFAQSIQWTGHYYIATGASADGPAAVVGYHDGWNYPEPITALREGEVIDFAIRPETGTVSRIVPDGRYTLLAVGIGREGPVAVAGFESEGRPSFGPGVSIPGIARPHSVAAARAGYFVVASRPAEGPVLTGDYVVAAGGPERWSVVPGPDFRGGVFADMAVAPSVNGVYAQESVVAVATLNGAAYAVRGIVPDYYPVFDMDMERLPGMVQAVSVEWAGPYFVVTGIDAGGRLSIVYGWPGAWNEAKTWVTNGVVPTDLAIAPTPGYYGKRTKAFDLLAIGTLKDAVMTLSGEDSGEFPMLYDNAAPVPGLGGSTGLIAAPPESAMQPSASSVTAPAPNPFTTASRIEVTVSREQPVLVEVFDGIGRRVAMLHNGMLEAGTAHSFALDAGDLPGGTYHFRVNGIDFSEVRTVSLAR